MAETNEIEGKKMSLQDLLGMEATEEFREYLLGKEFEKRQKQPEPWTKTKYRAYANFKVRRKEKDEIKEANGEKNIKAPKIVAKIKKTTKAKPKKK